MIVSFIGHSNSPLDLYTSLKFEIERLIKNENANLFYVGTHGDFDSMARMCLKELKSSYPHIKYFVVLAYLPNKNDGYTDYSSTIFPDKIESVPPRFAIVKRNKWMIEHSDTVICYVSHSFGNASKLIEFAEKKDKKIINIAKP